MSTVLGTAQNCLEYCPHVPQYSNAPNFVFHFGSTERVMPDDSNLVLKPPPLQAESPPIVLASRSAARRSLLESAGIRAEYRAADVDEHALRDRARARGMEAGQTALELARAKARTISVDKGAVVIGADQMLSCNGAWFDKPDSMDAARRQLRALRGRPHRLHTAVVMLRDGDEVWRHVACPVLHMRAFSDSFLERYLTLEGDAILSCVGCYRLEGAGIHLFSHIKGEHAAIVGLPLLALLQALRARHIIMQ
ncbi:septum formation inhibitor nucleotide-binding protein Maf [Komagataeibacter swingsii DSM 16373]|nr:septum formation inhibitor nucleotide-binding protein Maf [Komagataeibacter swingsii DSM 16373]